MKSRLVSLAIIALLCSTQIAAAENARRALLIRTLESGKSAWTRQGAAYQLGQQKDADGSVIQALEHAVHDKDWAVAYESTRALLNLGRHASAIEISADRFLKGLSDAEPEVRTISARAMILLRSPSNKIRHQLVRSLRDRNKDVARMCLLALGASRDPHVRRYLVDALDSSDWETRQFAAKALGLYADLRHGSDLAVSLQDPVQAVRWAALQSLILLGPSQAEHIALALNDPDASIRKRAQQVLLKYQEASVLQTAAIKDTK